MRTNLITRLKEEWNNLDPVDPLRGLIADAIDALAEAQPSKPLTDEEIWDEVKAADLDWQTGWSLDEDASNRYITFARAIEAAHGIKRDA